eukprot:12798632-Alexandrium_andersonii.AAC.1
MACSHCQSSVLQPEHGTAPKTPGNIVPETQPSGTPCTERPGHCEPSQQSHVRTRGTVQCPWE